MHKSGHIGLSLFISAPVFTALLALELYLPAIVFIISIATFASVPDVDIYLKDYDFTLRDIPMRRSIWIPVISLSNVIMNLFDDYIKRVPDSHRIDKISHRGITHTIWFAIAFGLTLVGLTSFILISINIVDIFYDVNIYDNTVSYYQYGTLIIVVVSFLSGFLSVLTHCLGDVVTPAGLNFVSPDSGYGYSLNFFYAKNEVANRSSIIPAIISLAYGAVIGVPIIRLSPTIAILGYIGVYLVCIPIWIFVIKSGVGNWIYKIYDTLN